jgi:hypothetical protein
VFRPSLPLHDAIWWAEKTRGYNFAKADINNADAFNRVLWEGTMGDKPYPRTRSGADLRQNRMELLKAAGFEVPAPKRESVAENKSID